jgi:hypothetical protein
MYEKKENIPATPARPGVLSARSDQMRAPIVEDDVRAVQERFRAVLSRESAALRAEGSRLFERLARPNWSVEWNLPRWLGEAHRINDDQKGRLVSANILGLGYVRLYDDRADADQAPNDRQLSLRLEALLLEAAREEYRDLIGDEPWFWGLFNDHLECWREAVQHDLGGMTAGALEADPCPQLSEIGRPLLIGCAAVCSLAGARSQLAAVEEPVRHYLAAAVLYDHLKDWQADLAAGRRNVFIRWMMRGEPRRQAGHDPLQAMYVALTNVPQVHGYVRLLLGQLERGVDLAQAAKMEGFAWHLQALHAEASESARSMMSGMDKLLSQAQAMLLSGKRYAQDFKR